MKPVPRQLAAGVLPLLLAVPVASTLTAQSRAGEPLTIAREGYLFAGGAYSTVGGRQVMSGQLYAEFQIPARQTRWLRARLR